MCAKLDWQATKPALWCFQLSWAETGMRSVYEGLSHTPRQADLLNTFNFERSTIKGTTKCVFL